MNEELNPNIDNLSNDDKEFENVLRPKLFNDFKGQNNIVENLKVFIEAAKKRNESLDHVLLHGPPGLGKTTLANIIANELGVNLKTTSGPVSFFVFSLFSKWLINFPISFSLTNLHN